MDVEEPRTRLIPRLPGPERAIDHLRGTGVRVARVGGEQVEGLEGLPEGALARHPGMRADGEKLEARVAQDAVEQDRGGVRAAERKLPRMVVGTECPQDVLVVVAAAHEL